MSRGRAPEPQRREKIRCAIYTRKSTEEGLDQEFNSLDAQREACAAYIMSQRHPVQTHGKWGIFCRYRGSLKRCPWR